MDLVGGTVRDVLLELQEAWCSRIDGSFRRCFFSKVHRELAALQAGVERGRWKENLQIVQTEEEAMLQVLK